jgi:glycosyltransferase involved in cell wall biosynthesis
LRKNGWLINPGNKKELLETMKQILQSSKQDIMKKKQASLAIIQNFTWDKVIKKTIDQLL